MTTTAQQHLTAFHPPLLILAVQKKDKTNSQFTTKILNNYIENIVVSSVLESIKGIQRNELFIKKGQPIKTLSQRQKQLRFRGWEAADDECVFCGGEAERKGSASHSGCRHGGSEAR